MASLKILVVDDDRTDSELMTEVFTSLQAEVRPVADSDEAIALINQERFDGIFLDLEMPSSQGRGLASLIRGSAWNRTTPIIAVTSREGKQSMQEAFANGANFFLQKPMDRQKLGNLFRSVRGGMLEQRRRYIRVPLQTEVLFDTGSRQLRGVSWNISMGGLQVEAGLRRGDVVRVQFSLPVSGAAIDAVGTVVWAAAERQGIQFTRISAESEQSIRQLVAEVEA